MLRVAPSGSHAPDQEAAVEIVPRIHSIPVGKTAFMGFYAPNVYLIVDGSQSALVDTGFADEESTRARLDYVRTCDSQLRYIVLTHTHRDHMGGAATIRAETGAEVLLHAAEVECATVHVDRVVQDGDVLELDTLRLEVVHTPGHSPGHICLYVTPDSILFSGDQVVGSGTTAMRPPEGDMAVYIDSLRRLLDYDIAMICPGHGPPVREPRRKIEELIQHRLEREQQVIAGLREGRVTIKELVDDIYPELDRRLVLAAQGQILAHLLKLEREGIVSPTGEGDSARYTLK